MFHSLPVQADTMSAFTVEEPSVLRTGIPTVVQH